MSFLSDLDWQGYIDIINEFHEDAFQEVIHWKSIINKYDRFGEDGGEVTEDIPLRGLVQYNYFRNWPINKPTTTGEIDKESIIVYFNNNYLDGLGYLDSFGKFKFNQGRDMFVIRDITYKPSGESQIAQAKGTPILHFIILKREEKMTGT